MKPPKFAVGARRGCLPQGQRAMGAAAGRATQAAPPLPPTHPALPHSLHPTEDF